MVRATKHLELAIDIDSDPITGSFSDAAQRSQSFTGWIELVAAIEAVRSSEDAVVGPGTRAGQTLGSSPGAKDAEL